MKRILQRGSGSRALKSRCWTLVMYGVALFFTGNPGWLLAEDPATSPPKIEWTSATTLSPSDRRHLFEEALHILGGSTNVISRWTSEVRYVVLGNESDEVRSVTRAVFDAVAGDSGLNLNPIAAQADTLAEQRRAAKRNRDHRLAVCDKRQHTLCANFVVLVSDVQTMIDLANAIPLRAVYRRSLESSAATHCFFVPFHSSRRQIERAFVFVRESLSPAMVATCLHEEIYQSFGLFNDVSGSQYFSFDNRVVPKHITPFDRALLASVYHPEVTPGSPAFRVVQRFMSSLDRALGKPEEK